MTYYLLSVGTGITIFAIYGLGLNVQWGWAGLLNLAFITFAALGAYITSVLTMGPAQAGGYEHYIIGIRLPFLLAMPVAALIVALFAAVVGAIALRRLRDDYFAIVTVAFGTIVFAFVSQNVNIFNGQVGLYAIPSPLRGVLPLGYTGYAEFFLGLCVVILIVIYGLLEMLFKSPFGRTVTAVRDDETSASAFGKNAYTIKLRAFVLGSIIAAIGGSLQAAYLQSYNPSAWDSTENFILYVAIFIGGTANSRGVILGIIVIAGLFQEATRYLPSIPGHPTAIDAIRQIAIGLLIIVVLRWRPQGLLPERRSLDLQGTTDVPTPSHEGGVVAR